MSNFQRQIRRAIAWQTHTEDPAKRDAVKTRDDHYAATAAGLIRPPHPTQLHSGTTPFPSRGLARRNPHGRPRHHAATNRAREVNRAQRQAAKRMGLTPSEGMQVFQDEVTRIDREIARTLLGGAS